MIVRVATILGLFVVAGTALAPETASAQSSSCRSMRYTYDNADGPKAWADGTGGSCGYYKGANSMAEARRRAMDNCWSASSRGGCHITAWSDE